MSYKCGLKSVDENTRGMKEGDVTLVAGISGGQKTNFLLNLAKGFQEQNFNVLFITLESDSLAIQQRCICRLGIKHEDLVSKPLTEDIKRKIREYGSSASARMAIGSGSYRTPLSQFKNLLITRALLKPFNILMIDTLDLIESGADHMDRSGKSVQGAAVREFRLLGAEYGFATIATTQVSRRASELYRTGKAPEFSAEDLAHGTGVAMDADNIFVLRPIANNNLEVAAVKLRYAPLGSKPSVLKIIPDQFRLEELPENPFDDVDKLRGPYARTEVKSLEQIFGMKKNG